MTRNTFIALALGSCTLGLLTTACHDSRDQKQEQTGKDVIKVFKIKKQQVTDTGEWFGYLRGKMDTDIRPRVTGFLVSQEYKDGTFVKEGDVLFRLDPDLYEAEYAQAQANLRAAQASLVSAEATRDQIQLDVTRYTQLVKTSAASEKELSDAQHNLRAAMATVDAAKANIEQQKAAVNKARINLNYTVIRAPYSGVVGAALASKGDLVSPATKLANITSIDPIRVDFSVKSEGIVEAFRRYGHVDSGESIHPAAPPIQLKLEDGSLYPYSGKILSIESKVDSTGLINIEGEVPNPDGALRGGMPVRVIIPTQTKEALLVPKVAIRPVLRSNFILITDKDNVPHSVPVTLDGEYDITVTEENGYTSTQKLVAIKGAATPLEETFRQYGYGQPEEVPVVADADNGVRAMNISSANSRIPQGSKAAPGRITPVAFSFLPEMTKEMQETFQQVRSGEKPADNPQAKASMPAYPVKVTPLLQQDVDVIEEWFGSLRGVEETEIRPQVSGFLLTQNFKNGSLVKQGDVLFTIDPAPYQAALDEAKANHLSAKAALEQAKSQLDMSRKDYERYQKLSEAAPGAVSEKTVTDAKTAVETNEAAVLKAEATIAQMAAAVKLAEINLGYTTITAPFDGRVGISKPSIGALVSSSDAEPLVTISSDNPMRVDFEVSGKMALAGISRYGETLLEGSLGKNAQPFELILEDGSLYPEQGYVVTSDNALSTTTGTLKVIGQVKNVDGALRSGMPVRVRAGRFPQKGAFLVPARAPLNAKGMDILLLLRPDNAPEMLPITKGALVVIPVNGVNQPMQVVDVNRSVFSALALAKTGAASLEAAALSSAHAKDWDELLLKEAGVDNFRSLLEQRAGSPLPDDAPQQAGTADWKALLLKNARVSTSRELALKNAGAKDELDFIALKNGYNSLMQIVLHEMGFEDTSKVQVITEGSIMAAQAYQANKASHSHANKLTPVPFQYEAPHTVVGSVTADKQETPSAQ